MFQIEPIALTTVEPGVSHWYPAFLPDGQHFLYTRQGGSNPGIYVASLDDPAGRRLLPDPSSAILAPAASGGASHLIFVRDGRLMAQPFDPTGPALRLYVGDAAASGTQEELVGNGLRKIVTDWSRDWYLLYTQVDPGTGPTCGICARPRETRAAAVPCQCSGLGQSLIV